MNVKRVENSISSAVAAALDTVDASARRILLAERSVTLAESALDTEEKRLENGLTTTLNMLSLQNELLRRGPVSAHPFHDRFLK